MFACPLSRPRRPLERDVDSLRGGHVDLFASQQVGDGEDLDFGVLAPTRFVEPRFGGVDEHGLGRVLLKAAACAPLCSLNSTL